MKKQILSFILISVLLAGLTACNSSTDSVTDTAAASIEENDTNADTTDESTENSDKPEHSEKRERPSGPGPEPSERRGQPGKAPGEASNAIDFILNSITNETFSTEPVSEEDLTTILQSGAVAPSGMNLQTWHFTVVRGEVMNDLARFAVEGNVVIVVSGENETVGNPYIDCSLATENMNLAAQALGYGARIYTSTATNMSDEMKTALEIPDNYTPITVLQIGHYADHADAVSSASTRTPLDGIVNYIGN